MNVQEISERRLSIALLCNDRDESDRITAMVVSGPHNLVCFEQLEHAQEHITTHQTDVVIACHRPDGLDAFNAARVIRERTPQIQTVIISEKAGLQYKAAMSAGALECLTRPVVAERLTAALQHCTVFLPRQSSAICIGGFVADLDPRHAILLVDHFDRIIYSNAAAQLQLHCDGLANSESFSLMVNRSLRDFQRSQVRELVTAVAAGCPWRGELAGSKATQKSVFECEVFRSSVGQGSSCAVVMRDITDMTKERTRLQFEAGLASDLLLARTGTKSASTESTIRSAFNLVGLIEHAFARIGAAQLTLEIPSQIPELFLAVPRDLQELFIGFAIHLQTMKNLQTPLLRISLKEKAGKNIRLLFELTAWSTTVGINSYESLTDYLGLLTESTEGSGLSAQGIFLAAHRITESGDFVSIKRVAGEKIVFSFFLWLTVAETEPEMPTKYLPESPSGSFNLWTSHASLLPQEEMCILVADDSLTDQLSIRAILEGEGYDKIVVVNNGREAVEEFEQGEYDLIFMDILMPLMDGFEASRLIRQQDNLSNRYTPIIALTSHALKAVYDKCLQVGMDGYLSKPVGKRAINHLFTQLFHGEKPNLTLAEMNAPTSADKVFGLTEMMERLGDDVDLARTIIKGFLQDMPQQLVALRTYLENDDAKSVERQAHTIKGAASNVNSEALRVAAFQMEMAAGAGELAIVRENLGNLETLFDRAKKQMDIFLDS